IITLRLSQVQSTEALRHSIASPILFRTGLMNRPVGILITRRLCSGFLCPRSFPTVLTPTRNARRSFLCRRERNAPAGSTDQPGSVAPSRYGPGASSPEISEQPFLRADSIDGRRPCAADCDGQPASPSLSAVQQRVCGWNGRGKLHLPFHATESTEAVQRWPDGAAGLHRVKVNQQHRKRGRLA